MFSPRTEIPSFIYKSCRHEGKTGGSAGAQVCEFMGRGKLMWKKSFMFTSREHSQKGIMATILGVISLASLVYIIWSSYTTAGKIPLQYGAVAFLTMIFAFVGIVLGVLSKSERDKFYFFSYLGIVLNVLVLATLSVILYAGAYA